MPTTFNVIYLGRAQSIDPTEGNNIAENADSLVGARAGSADDPLFRRILEAKPGSTGFSGGTRDAYDQDGSPRETLEIGGVESVFDALAVYEATLTYTDGTTAEISAVIFQDTNGDVFLAPEISANADQAALNAKPIQSLDIGPVIGDRFSGLAANRQSGDFATCFTPGTMIAAPGGPRAVETLRSGDLVETLDRGPRPVRWTGRSAHAARGPFAPIRIRAGALGGGLPRADLLVSRQHRMLIRSRVAERMFGAAEVFVPAVRLAGLPGIAAEEGAGVVYMHLLMDRHEVLEANGAPTESLLTGEMALRALGPVADRIAADHSDAAAGSAVPARALAEGGRAKRLIERIARNGRPLVEPAERGAAARAA